MQRSLAAAGILLGCVFLVPSARAAESVCELGSLLRDLGALESTTTLDYAANFRIELGLRKELLTKTVDCALRELQSLEGTLRSLPPSSDFEFERLRRQLEETLLSARGYYERQRGLIPNASLRELKDLARSLREWRRDHLLPATDQMRNVIHWSRNQEIFKIAKSRFEQVQQTLRTFRLTENDQIANLFREAEGSLEEALRLNEQGRRTLLQFDPRNDAVTFIKGALEALSRTYEYFLDVSRTVKALLSPPK